MKKVKLQFDWAEFKSGDVVEVADDIHEEMVNKYKIAQDYSTEEATKAAQKQDEREDDIQKTIDATVQKAMEAEQEKRTLEHALLKTELEKVNKNVDPTLDLRQRSRRFGEKLQAGINKSKREQLRIKVPQGMNEGVDADGGFLVDLEFSTELDRRMNENAMLLGKTRRVPIGDFFNGLRYNELLDYDRTDGNHAVNVFRTGEAILKAASIPQFAQRTLELEKLTGFYFATDELLRDVVSLSAMVAEWFGREFSYKNDFEIIRGTGVNQMTGILDAANTALVTLTRETINLVTTDDVTNMFAAMWGRSKLKADWYINSSVWPQLLQMTIGNQPMFIAPGAIPSQPAATLLGRPVIELEMASGLNTTGDIIFADLGEYRVIEKDGIESASSIHVRFQEDETAFRFVMNNNGAPIWTDTITPNQTGGLEQSPYIVLETGT